MIRTLIVETTEYGFNGITNVILNYYRYKDHDRVHMDLVTINPIDDNLNSELSINMNKNYVLSYRNHNQIKYIHNLTKIIKKGQYDIVHVHGCSATMAVEMMACKLAGVKVRIAHSHNTMCDHLIFDKLLRPFFNLWCNYRFACGEEAGKWLFTDKRFEVINNGVDLEKFQYNEETRNYFRTKFNLEDRFVVGHIGRFSEQKNHEKLLTIFAEIVKQRHDAKLVLIGDGELRSEIEILAHELDLDVMFVGLSNEVEAWLQAMDVVVFPSLFEGLPLGIVEAQAAGLPCVLSNTISPLTKITNLVRFVDLKAKDKTWAKIAIDSYKKYDRLKNNKYIKTQIRKSSYDIRENCNKLCSTYEDMVKGEYT